MASIRITTQVTNDRQVLQSGKLLGDYFGRLSDRRVREAAEGARDELAEPAPRPTYPIRWDSERQRRAFFATNGFGRGIPTTRTNAYPRGFKVKRLGIREYSVINDTGYASYVGGTAYGKRQSRIHQGRWPVVFEVVGKWARRLLELTADDLRRILRGEGLGL